MIGRDLQEAVTPLVEAFEALQVRYRIGGSVASSVFGMARSTLDVDLALDDACLEHWSRELGLEDLGARAVAEAAGSR